MKIKVCGMREPDNIAGVAALKPDYMGFIFYERSPRYAGNMQPETMAVLSSQTKRVGVFVDASLPEILRRAKRYALDIIQLHGDETPDFCAAIRRYHTVVKAFGIETTEDLEWTAGYEGCCDYFLFDTKTVLRGGSGKRFDHAVLSAYEGNTPFFLSGGVAGKGIENLVSIHEKCIAFDINSRFESRPGIKVVSQVADFLVTIRKTNDYEQNR